MWFIKPVGVCFSPKISLCPPPHKSPCWLEQAADSWSKILPCPLAENLSWLVSCQSCQMPVMKLKQASGTWCLVARGSWCGASQLFYTESQCSSATERILFANCEVSSSTRGAFKVISAICLAGDQALVVMTFRVPGQENCWPPPSLPFFNQTPLCSDCPACC